MQTVESMTGMKNYILKKYPRWEAVKTMPYRRVAAIYRSLRKREEPPGYHQITLFEWLEEREHG
jgi:hypothetical protein